MDSEPASPVPVELADPNAALPTPEDAQAFHDAARFRYEQQERNRDRFAARVRQLVVVLTGLGAGAAYLGDALLTLPRSPGWAWFSLLLSTVLLAVAVIVGLVYVVRMFWSADYKGLPAKMVYEQVWTEADYHHRANSRKGHDVARKTILLRQMADGLLTAVDHNVGVDARRQKYLDRSKLLTAVGAALFLVSLVFSFVIKSSVLPS